MKPAIAPKTEPRSSATESRATSTMLEARNGRYSVSTASCEQRDDEQDECGLDAVHQLFGTRTITDCSDEKSTSGETWMLLNAFTSLLLRLVTDPTGMPRGNIEGSAPGARACRR